VAQRDEIPPMVDLLVAAGVRVYGVMPRRRSLEDIFISIVEGDAPAIPPLEPALIRDA
jgi:hypothetical protein